MTYASIASAFPLDEPDSVAIRLVTPNGILYSICPKTLNQSELKISTVLFRDGEGKDFSLEAAESLLRSNERIKEILLEGVGDNTDVVNYTDLITQDPYANAPLTRLVLNKDRLEDLAFKQKFGVLTIGKNNYIVSHMLDLFGNESLNDCIPKVVLHINESQLPKWDSLLKKYWVHEDDLKSYLNPQVGEDANNNKQNSTHQNKSFEEASSDFIETVEKNMDQVVSVAKTGIGILKNLLK
ncbi:hypothetical protein A7M79_00720 [Acinetobacter baumannii]|uniref:hypothetical protein n=1 Tax=Acinetobacter baumannii TaxID=470 RepID=UPI0008DDDE27|nr:hypothetical protein [Acinetobacter baumannii]OIH12046.1 hypothetical protein A7M79_00720 [Acinetobacter baumannii]